TRLSRSTATARCKCASLFLLPANPKRCLSTPTDYLLLLG
ncbi:hypothetical protein KIPB_017328, partial [Kipferlia bialata]